jgi:hypothetical protein
MAGRGKRGPDIAGEIRGAFIRAVKSRQLDTDEKRSTKRKPLSQIMDDLLDENPIGLLNAMKGFVPKEVDLQATERPYESWLEEIAADAKEDK